MYLKLYLKIDINELIDLNSLKINHLTCIKVFFYNFLPSCLFKVFSTIYKTSYKVKCFIYNYFFLSNDLYLSIWLFPDLITILINNSYIEDCAVAVDLDS